MLSCVCERGKTGLSFAALVWAGSVATPLANLALHRTAYGSR